MGWFDIVGGKVVIHNDVLGIPCFKKVWDTDKPDKVLANKYISYIVLKNKWDSPYVKSMSTEDIEPRLKQELFGSEDYELPVEVLECESGFIDFQNTLLLKLLNSSRKKIDSISRYYENSLNDDLDEKKVKDILAGIAALGNVVKSIDTLEKGVRNEELSNSKVRGGAEMNAFEIPK